LVLPTTMVSKAEKALSAAAKKEKKDLAAAAKTAKVKKAADKKAAAKAASYEEELSNAGPATILKKTVAGQTSAPIIGTRLVPLNLFICCWSAIFKTHTRRNR
jgi:hypothetical protein